MMLRWRGAESGSASPLASSVLTSELSAFAAVVVVGCASGMSTSRAPASSVLRQGMKDGASFVFW